MNLKLVLEYDGAGFAGWQLQPQVRTVEGELRAALGRLPLEVRTLMAAGRTDAGAHAEGQVVNVHCTPRLPPERLLTALNAHLPDDVAVLRLEVVPESFHARYDARWRRYRYRYLDRPVRPALGRMSAWHIRGPLDVDSMAEAARVLVGRHDWTTFSTASEPERNRVREISACRVDRAGRHVELDMMGQGFLRGMVRGVAGALAEVGLGHHPPAWVGEILTRRDRRLAPRPGPARGLTLVEVVY
jgi:tRNA pseudouridine38-40 synthase